jgi:hypothetical protein
MEIQTKKETLSFSECVERELKTMMGERRTYGTAEYHFIQRGFYQDQIERFQAVFPNKCTSFLPSLLYDSSYLCLSVSQGPAAYPDRRTAPPFPGS